jgi:RecB family endonuclease NucS
MKAEDFTTSFSIDFSLGVNDYFVSLFDEQVLRELLDEPFRKMLNEEMVKAGVLKTLVKDNKGYYEYNTLEVAEWLVNNSEEIKTQFKRYLRDKARYATYVVENF